MTASASQGPPAIPGFTFISDLGKGGFADVFLYQQHSPQRLVAIKVLSTKDTSNLAAQRLRQEADAMAELSQHHNIVTIFQSGIADDGRAYLVMEYYPRPNLAQGLSRTDRSLAAVLAIGIQLAGAVESAHRLGIIHNDIKPANILIDKVRRPVLADFGISTTTTDSTTCEIWGMSIPYSPPEVFDSGYIPGPQSDIWELAATIYALLAGWAPFEILNGDNSPKAMIERIKYDPYRRLKRQDVPECLNQVLTTAMAKNPNSRYFTMQAFGLALNQVETELRIPTTAMEIIDLIDDDGSSDTSDTRLRPIAFIGPTEPSPPTSFDSIEGRDVIEPGQVERTSLQQPPIAETSRQLHDDKATRKPEPKWLILGVLLVLVIIGAVTAAMMMNKPINPQQSPPDGAVLQVVAIPDSAFKQCLNAKYLKQESTASITVEQLESITEEVTCIERTISSIEGAQHLRSIKILDLGHNQITDITPLANLTNVERLSLRENRISDITVLENLTDLDWLVLFGNQISDITPLAVLTNLAYLDLRDNQISSLEPLRSLNKLTHFYVDYNKISDITPLADLRELTELILSYNQITNIEPLANLTKLAQLYLVHNQIEDVSGLAKLTKLETLTLSENAIRDISVLAGLSSLEELSALDQEWTIEVSAQTEQSPPPVVGLKTVTWTDQTGTKIDHTIRYGKPGELALFFTDGDIFSGKVTVLING